MSNKAYIKKYILQLHMSQEGSHKGQNGKMLLIGGSTLFHAASKWSLDVASRFVDMVFYASTKENNDLVSEAKSQFWNGIVVPRSQLESYLEESDCIVIGPGMERVAQGSDTSDESTLTSQEWESNTKKIINYLLQNYPDKKWVVDAGALQMVDPHLLNSNCMILPHSGELVRVLKNIGSEEKALSEVEALKSSLQASEDAVRETVRGCTLLHQLLETGAIILFKGKVDCVFSQSIDPVIISGGSAGMTKGGTGDVLAGLVGALYCRNSATVSAVVGSYINKKAGEHLHKKVGPFFNASDLVEAVPVVLWAELVSLKPVTSRRKS